MIRELRDNMISVGGGLKPGKKVLGALAKLTGTIIALSIRPSICPHATSLPLLDRFSWFKLMAVTNVCPEILSLDKTGQKCTRKFYEGRRKF
jgi:hypothetical protein